MYNDGSTRVLTDFPWPARLAQPGDVYAARVPLHTLGASYNVGDRFAIVARVFEVHHHRLSSLGNLVVLCKAGQSVWSEFDAHIANGTVELVIEGKGENQEVQTVLRRLGQKNHTSA